VAFSIGARVARTGALHVAFNSVSRTAGMLSTSGIHCMLMTANQQGSPKHSPNGANSCEQVSSRTLQRMLRTFAIVEIGSPWMFHSSMRTSISQQPAFRNLHQLATNERWLSSTPAGLQGRRRVEPRTRRVFPDQTMARTRSQDNHRWDQTDVM
jgi:hypothetical protein